MKKKKKDVIDYKPDYFNIASLACIFIGAFLIYLTFETSGMNLMRTYSSLGVLFIIGSIAISAYTYAKYPKNKFAKVIIWIYIGIAAAIAIFFVITIVSCIIECQNMPG